MCHRESQARPTKLVKANLDKSRSKHIGSLVAEHIDLLAGVRIEYMDCPHEGITGAGGWVWNSRLAPRHKQTAIRGVGQIERVPHCLKETGVAWGEQAW